MRLVDEVLARRPAGDVPVTAAPRVLRSDRRSSTPRSVPKRRLARSRCCTGRPRKSILRPLVEAGRAADGLRLAPAELRGVRMLMKAHEGAPVVGILPDQVPSRGEGVWAPFFGRWAYTMTLPARLARQFDAIVLFVYGERLPGRRGLPDSPAAAAGAADRRPGARCSRHEPRLESLIRECPTQYLWGYNRYKVPAGAEHARAAADARPPTSWTRSAGRQARVQDLRPDRHDHPLDSGRTDSTGKPAGRPAVVARGAASPHHAGQPRGLLSADAGARAPPHRAPVLSQHRPQRARSLGAVEGRPRPAGELRADRRTRARRRRPGTGR